MGFSAARIFTFSTADNTQITGYCCGRQLRLLKFEASAASLNNVKLGEDSLVSHKDWKLFRGAYFSRLMEAMNDLKRYPCVEGRV